MERADQYSEARLAEAESHDLNIRAIDQAFEEARETARAAREAEWQRHMGVLRDINNAHRNALS